MIRGEGLSADGRLWVPEAGVPEFGVRPMGGAADDAVMEGVYDYWRLADEHDRSRWLPSWFS